MSLAGPQGRLLSLEQAASSVFVPTKTVETWVARGILEPAGTGLYWEAAVADAELRTRRRPRAVRLAELATD